MEKEAIAAINIADKSEWRGGGREHLARRVGYFKHERHQTSLSNVLWRIGKYPMDERKPILAGIAIMNSEGIGIASEKEIYLKSLRCSKMTSKKSIIL